MTLAELTPTRRRGPAADRWIPTRAGILNVWRYHDEVLEFDSGRLLLRGPNGSGKSKALEVLLPFLLDANLRPNRLSTFGTSERTMHWNLMGDGYDGATRVGYVWLEFGGPDGYFTCGARLQASRHTTTVLADYFTTTRRVGVDLELLDDDHAPLTRVALAAAMGADGAIQGSAGDYRHAVRRQLFPGLNEQRYDALISALLQLRTPKLSERLDPGLVSNLLSRALPPLGQQDIAELAEGFERLDRQREQLKRLDDFVDAATGLAGRTSTYARRLLRSAAQALIGATSTMDQLTRAARLSEEQHATAVTDLADVTGQRDTADQRVRDAATAIDALRDSDIYQEGKQLDLLKEQVIAAERAATSTRESARKRRVTANDAAAEQVSATHQVDAATATVSRERDSASQRADRVGLAAVLDEAERASAVDDGRRIVSAAVDSRQGQVREVRRVLREHTAAVRDRQQAETRVGEAELANERAEREQADARRAFTAAAEALVEQLSGWHRGLIELGGIDLDAVLDLATEQVAVRDLVSRASSAAREAIAVVETTGKAELAALADERVDTDAELQERLHASTLNPPAPATRTADRTDRPGNPLWQLIDFAPGVDPAAEPAIEAALQASGLLDAWLTPTGQLETAVGHDTFAVPTTPVPGPTLADVLVVEPGTDVPAEVVTALLRSIAYGPAADGPAAVGPDGQWRLATLRGSWAKADTEYIGATARERARQRDIARLRERLVVLDAAIDDVRRSLTELASRRARIDQELTAVPSYAPLTAAAGRVQATDAAVAAVRDLLARAVESLRAAEGAVDRALRALTIAAADAGLPSDDAKLEGIERALQGFQSAAVAWFGARRELEAARHVHDIRATAAAGAEAVAVEAEDGADRAEKLARSERVRLQSVEEALGASYQQVLAQLADLRRSREEAERQVKLLDGRIGALRQRIGELTTAKQNDAESREAAVQGRDAAADSFRRIAGSTVAEDAGVTVTSDDRVRSALDAARSLYSTWSVPHESRDIANALRNLSEELHSARQVLAERTELELVTETFGGVLTAQLDGMTVGAASLLRQLRDERDRGQSDITVAERELFDRTLTGDTRRHLADRIRQASGLVDRMNANLTLVRTASSVAVKLVWQVDKALPEGTKEARELLLKDPVRLSEADHEALHTFFRDRIDEARQANTAATWEQQLSEVFDYTKWHQFVVKLDRANGEGWQDLTKRLHGALSGGEKAIALHLPLFAAVAAHYESEPTAPRLIMLDEVFVGVDTTNRGQVFGLLAALDLDLVLTSDHEWCTYRELEGIAIHQLLGEDDVVTTARFVWTGAELVPDDVEVDDQEWPG